jgi:SAM-dependent methyltransferase
MLPRIVKSRIRFAIGLAPLSETLGTDRGLPICRYYTECFLEEFAPQIRGRCLEFQEDQYASRFGGERVRGLDILHIDADNPQATLVADLTRPNDLPDSAFDCILCTFVLHMIFDVRPVVAELHRMLKPGGVLLVVVTGCVFGGADDRSDDGDYWRFTPCGLHALLGTAFENENVTMRSYGNALTAAGQVRGLASEDFRKAELDHHDPRFGVTVCACAVRAT